MIPKWSNGVDISEDISSDEEEPSDEEGRTRDYESGEKLGESSLSRYSKKPVSGEAVDLVSQDDMHKYMKQVKKVAIGLSVRV